jgi:hypothetical protein
MTTKELTDDSQQTLWMYSILASILNALLESTSMESDSSLYDSMISTYLSTVIFDEYESEPLVAHYSEVSCCYYYSNVIFDAGGYGALGHRPILFYAVLVVPNVLDETFLIYIVPLAANPQTRFQMQ